MPLNELDIFADILAFHVEAGVDAALGEAPIDRFKESAAEASARAAARPAAVTPAAGRLPCPKTRSPLQGRSPVARPRRRRRRR